MHVKISTTILAIIYLALGIPLLVYGFALPDKARELDSNPNNTLKSYANFHNDIQHGKMACITGSSHSTLNKLVVDCANLPEKEKEACLEKHLGNNCKTVAPGEKIPCLLQEFGITDAIKKDNKLTNNVQSLKIVSVVTGIVLCLGSVMIFLGLLSYKKGKKKSKRR